MFAEMASSGESTTLCLTNKPSMINLVAVHSYVSSIPRYVKL